MNGDLAGLRAISLDELNGRAELLARSERKYVVDAEVAAALVAAHASRLAALEIGSRREFTYESVYFDTTDLALYRAAATGRRKRYKVRTRWYVDSGVAMVEVKSKDGRGRTVKARLERGESKLDVLCDAERTFVARTVGTPGAADSLGPTLTTRYRRSTLADLAAGTRATVDHAVVCTDRDGRSVDLDAVIIETKSDRAPSALDRWLWHEGIRPEPISKYCTGLALLEPGLPSHRWRRTLRRHFSGT